MISIFIWAEIVDASLFPLVWGSGEELNPLMHHVALAYGPLFASALKLACVLLVVRLLRRVHPILWAYAILMVVAVSGAISELLALIYLTP
jgi:hypothetical protein